MRAVAELEEGEEADMAVFRVLEDLVEKAREFGVL
jgi:hypothetical protein